MTDLGQRHKFPGMSVTLPTSDVKAMMKWYVTRLGFKPYFMVDETAARCGLRLGRAEICFCEGEPLERDDQSFHM